MKLFKTRANVCYNNLCNLYPVDQVPTSFMMWSLLICIKYVVLFNN